MIFKLLRIVAWGCGLVLACFVAGASLLVLVQQVRQNWLTALAAGALVLPVFYCLGRWLK